jgi:hypothetical protein
MKSFVAAGTIALIVNAADELDFNPVRPELDALSIAPRPHEWGSRCFPLAASAANHAFTFS